MFAHRKQPGTSPAVVANSWLDRRMAIVLDTAHRRSRRRITVIALVVAVTMGIVAFVSASVTSAGWAASAITVGVLATIVALLTAVALYPVLRLRNRWLLQAAATISHDNLDLLSVLGKLTELRDGETAGHNLRVTTCTLLFAEAVGFSRDEIVRTVKGALLHDVGKLAVPDRILHKPGPLTPDERAEMNKHVRYGLDIVSQSHILREATPVVAAHHERYDGTGYPFGLKAEAIPREARLFALVDVFDALTSARVYKPAFGVEEALVTMTGGRGSHFDPILFDRFKEVAPDFARHLPSDEAELTSLLMNRLLPYVDRFIPVQPIMEVREDGTQSHRFIGKEHTCEPLHP
jgi:putative nucleotidyltransferase with HDIG domain